MRKSNTYRAAKRNEARSRRLVWRTLDKVRLSNSRRGPGTVSVKHPFEKNGTVVP
jgi:hypothetical protein